MTSTDTWSGYANRETWAVALYVDNDEGWQESVLESLRQAGPDLTPQMAGQVIRENVESTVTSSGYRMTYGEEIPSRLVEIAEDIGSLWRVDWDELGDVFLATLADVDGL